jgi:hypothetical protein
VEVGGLGVMLGVGVGGGLDVYVAVGLGVLLGTGVFVRFPGRFGWGVSVFVGAKKVPDERLVEFVDVAVGTKLAVLVGEISENVSGWEKACTVSTIMVFIFEMTKSTRPSVCVPSGIALLISDMPTTATPHSRLTPITAAITSPSRGTYSLAFAVTSGSRTISPGLRCSPSLRGLVWNYASERYK